MIPKFRAYHKELKMMFEVLAIDFFNKAVTVKFDKEHYRIYSFDDIILMQSTGLFDKNGDKNGVEIFEGDVVHAYDECGSSLVGEVIYCDNAYCLKDNGGICNNLWINAEKYEVIGSIYQNSYLLESMEE